MASRYVFALCALALIATVIAEPEDHVDKEDIENVWTVSAALIKEGEGWMVDSKHQLQLACVKYVFKKCDIKQENPKGPFDKFYKCIANYFQTNVDSCVKPK